MPQQWFIMGYNLNQHWLKIESKKNNPEIPEEQKQNILE